MSRRRRSPDGERRGGGEDPRLAPRVEAGHGRHAGVTDVHHRVSRTRQSLWTGYEPRATRHAVRHRVSRTIMPSRPLDHPALSITSEWGEAPRAVSL